MVPPDVASDPRRLIALDPPALRGVLHTLAIPVAVVAGIVAIVAAPTVLTKALAAVYGGCQLAMFMFSAAFHRFRWGDTAWWRMRQLDHTGIYLMIAGSFTGIGGIALSGPARIVLLAVVWGVATLGITYRWLPVVPPFGLMTTTYILLSCIALPFLPQLGSALGAEGLILLGVGCALYFVGALALGARVPDLWPRVFGYHEVWHVLVVVAAALHFVVVLRYAIPAAELTR